MSTNACSRRCRATGRVRADLQLRCRWPPTCPKTTSSGSTPSSSSRDVPTDWETSRTLQSEIGDYVVGRAPAARRAGLVPRRCHRRERAPLVIPLDFLARAALRSADLSRLAPAPATWTIPPRWSSRSAASPRATGSSGTGPGWRLAVRFKAL
jgi:alpha-glucosidase